MSMIYVLKPTWAFQIARGLKNELGLGLIALWAYVVRTQHHARAHGSGLGPFQLYCDLCNAMVI